MVSILSAYYLIGDNIGFYNNINNLKAYNCIEMDLQALKKYLPNINTRFVDRQSLYLAATINPIINQPIYSKIDFQNISLAGGSNSLDIYPRIDFLRSIKQKGENLVSALAFPSTVGNAPVSRACIWFGFKNKVVSLADGIVSGLDSIITGTEFINEDKNFCFACASEEYGAISIFLGDEGKSKALNIQPIINIKNYHSGFLYNHDEFKDYIKDIIKRFNINIDTTCFYISGVQNQQQIFNTLNLKTKFIASNLGSLNPMIDICLLANDFEFKEFIVMGLDRTGFVSTIFLSNK